MENSSDSSLDSTTNCPAIDQKSIMTSPSAGGSAWPGAAMPATISVRPTVGVQGTVINVHVPVRHASRLENVKVMVGGIVLDTHRRFQPDGSLLLWAHAPPLHQTNMAVFSSSAVAVPVALCLLDSNPVSQLLVGHFTYQNFADLSGGSNDHSAFRHSSSSSSGGGRSRYNNILPSLESSANQDCAMAGFLANPRENASSPTATDESLSTPPPAALMQQRNLFPLTTATTSGSKAPLNASPLSSSITNNTRDIPASSSSDTLKLAPANEGQATRQHQRRKKSNLRLGSLSLTRYVPYPSLSRAIDFEMLGDFESIGQNWSQQEIERGRRLVRFTQISPNLFCRIQCSFEILSPTANFQDNNNNNNNEGAGVVISFIHWAQRDEIYVTSVDIIYLLQYLLQMDFSIEQKNRIRRNLEGFHPLTASKCKPESAEFFKVIMSFGYPRPRHIEKDIKIFEWHCLPFALKKIVVKYSSLIHRNQALFRSLPAPSPHHAAPATSRGGDNINFLQQQNQLPSHSLMVPPSPLQPPSTAIPTVSRETLDCIQRFNNPNTL